MRGGNGMLENAVSPSKNSLATATFRLYKSDKFGWIFSGKAEDISEKCSRHCQKAQWSHSFEINPDECLLIFCQITSYPKLQEERFKKENTDFNDGNGYFEQLRTGNIEPVEIKLLNRKPQTMWAIRTVEPIMPKLLLRCPGLSSAPTPTQHCSQGPCWFSVLFKIFPIFPSFYYHTSELLPHSRPARQVKMLSPGHQSWLLVLPHPLHVASPV